MQGHGEKLTRRQDAAILALLTHPSIPEAAKAAQVSPKTLWRWMQREDFQAAYQRARREVVRRGLANLQEAVTEAVQTLRDVMADPKAPASARVSAARTVLESALRAVEIEDLQKRLAEIEEKVERAA